MLNLKTLYFKKKPQNIKKKIVIKIDVEGVEHNVIKELKKSNILKNTQSIFVEIRNPNISLKKSIIKRQLKKVILF